VFLLDLTTLTWQPSGFCQVRERKLTSGSNWSISPTIGNS
jgi:hypothetical protein